MSVWDVVSDAWDGATDLLEDAGEVLASGAEAVGDAVEGAVDGIADTIDGVVDGLIDKIEGAIDAAVTWVNENGGSFLGGIVNVIGGAIIGILEGMRDIVNDIVSITKDVGSILGAILRLDGGGVIQGFVDLIIDVVDLFVDIGRIIVGGTIVGGIVNQFEREALRDFVKGLLKERFGWNAALLERIENKLDIENAGWGLRMTGQHYVLMLDSIRTPLWQWHQDGTLDLYDLAGVLSFDSFQVERPRTWVRVVGTDGHDNIFPVTRWVIKEYIESKGEKRRLRVYAMDRQAVAERLDVAVEKCATLGVRLSWSQSTAFYRGMFPVQEIQAKEEYNFALVKQGSFVIKYVLRTGVRSEECILLALGAFQLTPSKLGQTAGRDIREGSDASHCPTPGRNDSCCVTIPAYGTPPSTGSSAVHRDFWPSYVFRYILAHEIGHYLGLCHYGHNGVQNIMYTKDKDAHLNMVDWGLFNFYLHNEPEFSLSDGKNVWRFIVHQLPCCLDDSLIVTAPDTVTR